MITHERYSGRPWKTTLDIPAIPPSDNHRLIIDPNAKRGKRRIVTGAAARSFYSCVTLAWARATFEQHVGWQIVDISIVWPDWRRRDPSNLFKVTLDALVKARVIVDDCEVLARIKQVKRCDATHKPGILVEIYPASAELVP